MNRAEQINAFCSALLGGPDGAGDDRLDGWSTYLWTLDRGQPRPAKTTLWTPANPGSMASILHREVCRQPDQISAIYVSLGMAPTESVEADTQRNGESVPAHRRRLMADDVQGIPGLWADIDIVGAGHAGTMYPPDQDAALRVVHALELPPSIVVHSGGGLQAYWLFDEPWLAPDAIDPVAERRAMAELSRDLINTLRYHARRIGEWTVDSVFNLDRVMRAPGSLNTKTDQARPVHLLSIDPTVRYDPDEIREHLAPDDVLAEFTHRSITGVTGDLDAALPGIDLPAAWRSVCSAPDRTPEWLASYLDELASAQFQATWIGERTDLGDDPSRYDAALARLLANDRVGVQRQAEAVMARRIRAGQTPDKVNPSMRTDYILRTLVNVRRQVEAVAAESARRDSALRAVMEAAVPARVVEPPRSNGTAPAPASNGNGQAPETPSVTTDDDTPPWDDPPPPAVPPDELADVANAIIAGEPEPEIVEPSPSTPADRRADRVRTEPRDEPERRTRPDLRPVPDSEPEVDDHWGERSEETGAIMRMLGELLIPESYRNAGVQVWGVQQRDRGPSTQGRMVLRLPEDMAWPNGHRPPTFRTGRPLYCDWYKRDEFEVPRGFRRSLERDARITAQLVGNNKEEWQAVISALVPYWSPDTSGSDMATQMHEWLLEYLISRPATATDSEALTAGRPLLLTHNEWGVLGAPEIMVSIKTFLEFIATQPGGKTGRDARTLLDFVNHEERRPRLADADGQIVRGRWMLINPGQFAAIEWRDVLAAIRQDLDGRERRNGLRAVRGR